MYKILPSDYYWRAKELFEEYERTENNNLLFYSALEFRNCIESMLFGQLRLLNIDDLTKKYQKLYRAKKLSATILKIEPNFLKKLKFINRLHRILDLPELINIPDLEYLNQLYGKLGFYLHAPKNTTFTIDKDDWWNEFVKLIQNADNYIIKVMVDLGESYNLNEKGLIYFDKWNQGKISDSELIELIRAETYNKYNN